MILAIDLGGTKLQYALFEDNTPLTINSEPTQRDFTTQLKIPIKTQNSQHPGLIKAISLGVPGPTKNNVMQGSKPLNYLEHLDFNIILNRCCIKAFKQSSWKG